MSQRRKIEITAQHALIVKTILTQHLPANNSVFVFGSRAKGNVKPHSDLDLAIEAKETLSMETIAVLNEAFDESLLPYKVDIVDLNSIDEEFKKEIEVDCIPFE